MRQALLISIWQLSAIFLTSSPLKLCQVGCGQTLIFRFLQKYYIGFKLRLCLGHSRTFTELWIRHSCYVFKSIVPLEGKPSARLRFWMLWIWVFIKTISIFWCIELFFYSDESFSPCHIAWGCYQQTLPLGWCSAGDEQSCIPSNKMRGIELHQTRLYYFSQSEDPWGVFL